jgi:DNA-binding transcriptional LysR family regulator
MQPDRTRKAASAAGKPKFVEHLDLYRLVVFHTLVDEVTMSKASERLFITQPAISAHIKALEREMGVPLFNRVGRGSVVSSAGQVLYEKAERLFTVVDELKVAMENFRGVSVGRLSLGASLVWQSHLPRPLDILKREYPHVELSAQVANSDHIEKLVMDRSVDIGFIARASGRAELVSERLAEDEVVPVCGAAHPLAVATGRDPGELEGEAFVVREAGSAVRWATNEMLAASGIAPNISMELGSQEAIKHVVMAGQGIGMVSRAALEPELHAGLLAIPGAGYLRSALHLHVIYHKQKKLTFTQRAFLDLIASDGVLLGTRLGLLT